MTNRGFTLVEILVTLIIVSVGMLALGSFYTTMIMQESVAQERIAAVHMAEQLIEDWELNDKPNSPVPTPLPTPSCTPAVVLQLNTPAICQAKISEGVPVRYTITLNETPAKAPLPITHPNNPNTTISTASGANAVVGTLLQQVDTYGNVIQNSPQVMVRSVKISWKHDTTHQVQLTHITRYIQ